MEAEARKGRVNHLVKALGAYSQGCRESVKMFNWSEQLGSGAPFISHWLIDWGHLTSLSSSLPAVEEGK